MRRKTQPRKVVSILRNVLYLGLAFAIPFSAASIYAGMPTRTTVILFAVCMLVPPLGLIVACLSLAALILPHELGHWAFGSMGGLRLYGISIGPVRWNSLPKPCWSLDWNLKILGGVWMWRPDGSVVSRDRVRMLIGGPVGSLIGGGLLALLGLIIEDPDLRTLTLICAAFVAVTGPLNLLPYSGPTGSESDGKQILKHIRDQEAASAGGAVSNGVYLYSYQVFPSKYPAKLRTSAFATKDPTVLSRAYRLFIIALLAENADELGPLTEEALRVAENWPMTKAGRQASGSLRALASIIIMRWTLDPQKARQALEPNPETSGCAGVQTQAAIALIEAVELGIPAAEARLQAAVTAAKKSRPAGTEFWLQAATLQLTQRVLDIVEAMPASMYELQRVWWSGKRPRDWPPDLLPELDHCDNDYWYSFAHGWLNYLADTGRLDELRTLIPEVLAAPHFTRLLPVGRSLLYTDIAICSALLLDDLTAACDAIDKLEECSAPNTAMSHLARAAVTARLGRHEDARRALKASQDMRDASPGWVPRWEDDQDRIDQVLSIIAT